MKLVLVARTSLCIATLMAIVAAAVVPSDSHALAGTADPVVHAVNADLQFVGMMQVAAGCLAHERGPSGVPWTVSVAWTGACQDGLAQGVGYRWVARNGKPVAVSIGNYSAGRFLPPFEEVSIRLGRAVYRRVSAYDEAPVEQVVDAKSIPAWAAGITPLLQQAARDRELEMAQYRSAAKAISVEAPTEGVDAVATPVDEPGTGAGSGAGVSGNGADEQPKHRIF